MFLNNNIISNNKINNYDLLHNELTSISYIISFLKECYKNKLYPTSSDIIKFIHVFCKCKNSMLLIFDCSTHFLWRMIFNKTIT